jgi:hypothetical protein
MDSLLIPKEEVYESNKEYLKPENRDENGLDIHRGRCLTGSWRDELSRESTKVALTWYSKGHTLRPAPGKEAETNVRYCGEIKTSRVIFKDSVDLLRSFDPRN